MARTCSIEGCENHCYGTVCFRHKPRKPIPQQSNKYGTSMAGMKRRWFDQPQNQPTFEGYWICWLKISPKCKVYLTDETIRLEHVYPKTHYQHLRFNHNNILPTCDPCNELKGSIRPDRLVEMYPHLKAKIDEVTAKVLT